MYSKVRIDQDLEHNSVITFMNPPRVKKRGNLKTNKFFHSIESLLYFGTSKQLVEKRGISRIVLGIAIVQIFLTFLTLYMEQRGNKNHYIQNFEITSA